MQVIKIGGNELDDPQFLGTLAAAIQALPQPPVLVHGGGRGTTDLMTRLGIPVRFEQGLRVTDDDTLGAAVMGLVGTASTQLVAALVQAGVPALGLSGVDAGLVSVSALNPALGWVGTPVAVDGSRLQALSQCGFVPCLAPICLGSDGHLYNVNADDVAAAVAAAVKATSLIYLSNVAGLMVHGRVLDHAGPEELEALIADGTIQNGMIPKVRAAASAVRHGVSRVVITNLAGLDPGTHITVPRSAGGPPAHELSVS